MSTAAQPYDHPPFKSLLQRVADEGVDRLAAIEDDLLYAIGSCDQGLNDGTIVAASSRNTKGDFFNELLRALIENRSGRRVGKGMRGGFAFRRHQTDLVYPHPQDLTAAQRESVQPWVIGEAKVIGSAARGGRASSQEIDKRVSDIISDSIDLKLRWGGQTIVLEPDLSKPSGLLGISPRFYGFFSVRANSPGDAEVIRRKMLEADYYVDRTAVFLYAPREGTITTYQAVGVPSGHSIDEVIDLFTRQIQQHDQAAESA